MYLRILCNIALISLVVLSGCKKDGKPDVEVTPKNAEVYLTGSLQTSNFYWKNGDMKQLNDGGPYYKGIAADKNDVYIAGYTPYPFKAVYWKNDVLHELGFNGMAIKIAISDNDIYTAGVDEGKIWYAKNNERTLLQTGDLSINGFIVNGTDVYMAVAAHAYSEPIYFKNTMAYWLDMPGGCKYAGTHDIAIKGNDMYIVGEATTNDNKVKAVYWKNGVVTALTDGSTDAQALCVKFSGNDVYIAGAVKNAGGLYVIHCWKNGQLLFTADKSIRSYCTDMSIVGNDVYISGVTGREKNVTSGPTSLPAYWKNTEKYIIADNDFEVGYAYYMAVK